MLSNVFGPTPVATAGVCVFGQGDCGPKVNNVSQSFNQTLTENIKNTLISKSTSIGAVMATDQVIDFSGADMSKCEEVTISGISQKAVLNYNFSMLESSIDESQFVNLVRGSVEKTLDQKTDAKSEALNGGNTGVVNNISQTYSNSVDRLVNSINYNDFKNIMSEMRNRQRISFAGMTLGGKFCKIENISQDVMMEMAARMLSEKITKEFTQLAKENEVKEATVSQSSFAASGVLGDLGRGISGITNSLFTGLGNLVGEFTKPMIMIGIIILVIIVAYVIYRALMSGKAEGMVKDEGEMKRLEIEQQQLQGQQFVVNPAITGETQPQPEPQVETVPLVTQYEADVVQAPPAAPTLSEPGALQAGVTGEYEWSGEYEGEGVWSDIKDATSGVARAVGEQAINIVDVAGSAVGKVLPGVIERKAIKA